MDHLDRPDPGTLVPDAQTLAVLRAVIGVLGEDWGWYAQAGWPPEHLRLAVRAAPGPVLRGLLVEVVEELCRRRASGAEP